MIKENELRIGNLVYDKIMESNLTVSSATFINGTVFISPIPITEDWLLKFGLDRNEDDNKFFNGYYGIGELTLWNRKLRSLEDGLNAYWLGVFLRSIQYVHELQNLFFALTGQELTVKELV